MAQQPIINYFLPPSIQFGAGAIKNLGEHIHAFGGKKPLIVTDDGVTNAGILSKTVQPLEKRADRLRDFRRSSTEPDRPQRL